MSAQNPNPQPTKNSKSEQQQKTPKWKEPPPENKRLPMVGWYHPPQLIQTGVEVAISTIFGRHSDHRLVEAIGSGKDKEDFFDYTYDYIYYDKDGKEICETDKTKPRNSIWIDYVGDVGDGWNSTYTIAYHLAETGRTFTYADANTGDKHQAETKRGDLLIFGGDEVYPTASREMYEARLVAPYETALLETLGTHPHVFAVPGNHDWYDSLVAFTRLFTAHDWFGGWRTRQKRSYFALKLPHNWWLLGTDVQLGSDIDAPQMKYFESLAHHMDEEEKNSGEPASIILCHAEPHWIRAAQYGGYDPNYNESNLQALEQKLGKKRNVAVFIAGDLHHYRRHEEEPKCGNEEASKRGNEKARKGLTQKITAGGGGAFLHPTHYGILGKDLDEIEEKAPVTRKQDTKEKPNERNEIDEKALAADKQGSKEGRIFKLKACFPPTKESRKITWRNLIFPYLKGNKSRTFGIVTAALYLLLTLTLVAHIDEFEKLDLHPGTISGTAIHTALYSVPTMFIVVLTIVGFMFFTDTHSTIYRIIMGSLHAVAHILAAFLVALVFVYFVTTISAPGDWRLGVTWLDSGFRFYLDARMLLASLLIMVGGFIIGSFIMGIYLLLSLNFFGRHGNEAFSVLGVEDWKNFIRLHINEQGHLTIYPIGIRRVPRKWKELQRETGPKLVADDPRATKPELIERPIVMKKDKTTDTGVYTSSSDLKIEGLSQSSTPSGS
jgi:Calcineurin-like phosphoesterase